jgi:phosphoglycerate kinase
LPFVCFSEKEANLFLHNHLKSTRFLYIERELYMNFQRMTDLDLTGKRVLIREDLNVPVKNGVITSDARLRAALPTIKAALAQGAALMVYSHLGRPVEGEPKPEQSLAPVAAYLTEALGQDVQLVTDYLDGVEVAAGQV